VFEEMLKSGDYTNVEALLNFFTSMFNRKVFKLIRMISVLDKLLETSDDISIIKACQTFSRLKLSQNLEDDWELKDYYDSIV